MPPGPSGSGKVANIFLREICKLSRWETRPPPSTPTLDNARRIAPFLVFGARVTRSYFANSSSKFPVIFRSYSSKQSQSLQSRGLRQPAFGRSSSVRPDNKVQISAESSGPKYPPKFSNMDRCHYFLKPLAFTAFVGTASVIGCTIWQYEEYRKAVRAGRFSLSNIREAVFGPCTEEERAGGSLSETDLTKKVKAWWNCLSPGEKVFWPICGINAAVWLAWRIPSWAPTMVNYFSCTPVGRKICLPMLLSTFSHYSFLHLCANMFVLHSFIPAAAQILGKEQLVAMYLTSGTVASLGSHFHKIFIRSTTPSLGASGAIMGILGLVCTRMPDIQLGIIFLPGVQFTADTALKCILAIDGAGVLLGWRFMDHAAHLSGCLFGVAFSYWGGQTFWAFRDFVMTQWHKYRTSQA